MAAPDAPMEPASPAIAKWRRRSRVVRVLRFAIPAAIVLILAGLGASVAYNAMRPTPEAAQDANQPIRLLNPRFVGRDDKGRAFAVTAASATRDRADYQKVYLDHPALVIDEEGPDPTRITSKSGVYHEATGKLEVSDDVRMAGNRGAVETAQSQFDTKTGELTGSGPVHGSGPLGEIDAKSYSVQDKGNLIEFGGRVHTRLIPK